MGSKFSPHSSDQARSPCEDYGYGEGGGDREGPLFCFTYRHFPLNKRHERRWGMASGGPLSSQRFLYGDCDRGRRRTFEAVRSASQRKQHPGWTLNSKYGRKGQTRRGKKTARKSEGAGSLGERGRSPTRWSVRYGRAELEARGSVWDTCGMVSGAGGAECPRLEF